MLELRLIIQRHISLEASQEGGGGPNGRPYGLQPLQIGRDSADISIGPFMASASPFFQLQNGSKLLGEYDRL
jgi:hypothetical protein